MAYEIISQNNTVTTLADENGNVIRVPSRAILASDTTFTVTAVNNNTATLTDSNGKVYRDIPCVAVLYGGSGGGGSAVESVNGKTGVVVLDALDVGAVPQVETMTTPTQEEIVQYIGATDATYTNGYFYKSTGTTTYTDSTTFNPASISGTMVTATAGALAGLVAEYGSGNITDIIKGTLTYDQSSDLLVFVGLDDTDTQVCTFQLYTQDYTDAGFTFTGTLADGDVINFATTISEVSTTYSWSRIDVQPQPAKELPSQTGNSGKFLTTDGTDASWSDKPLVNSATGTDSVSIMSVASGQNSVVIGHNVGAERNSVSIGNTGVLNQNNGSYAIAIGTNANTSGSSALSQRIAIGNNVTSAATKAIQLGFEGTNSDANTFKVANANGNFEIMSANGTVPHARLTNAVVSNSITIAAADWNGGTTCTKTVSGLTATSVVWVAPDNASQSDYLDAGVYASAQTTDTITFTCSTTPTSSLTVNVIYC